MGNLKPGATYIYERADGVVYAREFGEVERFPIGWEFGAKDRLDEMQEAKLWKDINRAAKTNQLLQDAINRVKILYELGKKDGEE